ncbi:MAG: cob(I)yrinic acid a,c-diamide adenosyltransferase [Candidatus Aenigmarchaeota archaeon]|nr:cob(I)yrinic acid a,c-diamide adenosyltransferase [Candidatus Aenigmarchaeota archaeon]
MKIFQDNEETSLYGRRTRKDSVRIGVIGTLDELNSFVGLAVSRSDGGEITSSIIPPTKVGGLSDDVIPSSPHPPPKGNGFRSEDEIKNILKEVQRDLFVAGADVATPFDITEKHQRISHDDVKRLEDHISRLENELEPLNRFILPGGSREAAVLHICRTICRRAERSIVALKAHEELNNYVFVYINRLSDLFFVLARAANKRKGAKDEEWL